MAAPNQYQPVVLAYLERAGMVLLTLRPQGVAQAGKWEFPGGKVREGETFPAALARELWEEIAVTVTVGEEIAMTRHAYPEGGVELHLFRCILVDGDPSPREVAAVRWTPRAQLHTIPFPSANSPLLAALNIDAEGGEDSCPKG